MLFMRARVLFFALLSLLSFGMSAPVMAQGSFSSQAVTTSTTQPAAPAFSPAGGTYVGVQMVTITSSTPGATIYYTTDGSTPTVNSLVYSQPLPVNESLTINAIAVAGGDNPSDTTTIAYTIKGVAGIISTYAGGGTVCDNYGPWWTYYYCGDGGPATSARMAAPVGGAIDKRGNLYISDFDGNMIRMVNSAGIISTYAGNGVLAWNEGGAGGFSGDGGDATSAQLSFPWGIAVDGDGSLYISDTGNERIRKVTPDGIITTVVGDGFRTNGGQTGGGYSGDGGQATSAELNDPLGVTVDSVGNVYIADTSNNVIRKVNPQGIISTVAGNGYGAGTGWGGYSGDGGLATETQLYSPCSVAVDSGGNLYISDSGNNRIRRVTPDGVITTVAGNGYISAPPNIGGYSGDGGPAVDAELNGPEGLALDALGDLYFADTGNNVIRRVSSTGIISTVAGSYGSNGHLLGYSGDGGPATSALFHFPVGVAVDGSGNLYIADFDNTVIRKVTFTSNYQPVGNLDEAVDSVSSKASIPQNDSVYISGWAADPVDGAPLTTVKVYIDGVSAGTPTLGIARLDVANAYNNPAYTNSGFVLAYPASSLSVGSHTVTVSATDSAGTVAWFNTLTINVVAAPKPPVGNFDLAVDNVTASEPVHQSDILYTQGWAADYQASGAVATVSIVIDGTPVGNATLGQSRPDVAAYFNNPPWANTGWVYSMSAANLSAGSHTITAYATDHTGLVTWLNTLTVTVVP